MFGGLLILGLGALLLWPLERWVHEHWQGLPATLAEHVYLPWARAGLIVLFLIWVFPAPLLHPEAVAAASTRIFAPASQSLVNWLFFSGLLLPLLPATRHLSGLILPLQTLLGAWLLLRGLEQGSGISLHCAWGAGQFLGWIGLLLGSHLLLRWLSRELHLRWPGQALWSDVLSLYDGLALLVQPPLVLLFTRSFVTPGN